MGSLINFPEENVIRKKTSSRAMCPLDPTCVCDGGELHHKLVSGLLFAVGWVRRLPGHFQSSQESRGCMSVSVSWEEMTGSSRRRKALWRGPRQGLGIS